MATCYSRLDVTSSTYTDTYLTKTLSTVGGTWIVGVHGGLAKLVRVRQLLSQPEDSLARRS